MVRTKLSVFCSILLVVVAAVSAAMLVVPHAASSGNTAPILDNSGAPQFGAGFLNHFDPPGTRVADMLATGAGGNPIADPDLGAIAGVAVAWVDDSHGTWQFSTDSGVSWTDFPTRTITAGFNLNTLGNGSGFALNGAGAQDQSGWSVSRAGDVNGDGLDDVIVGANQADPAGRQNAGAGYVIFGSMQPPGASLDLGALNGSNGFAINGVDAADFSGHAVSGAGDVNNDGYDDVIIGAIHADPGNRDSAGEVYVVFGGPAFSAALDLSSLNGSNGFVLNGINGVEDSDKAGYSVSGAGDVNGDGIDDVVIGAPFADPGGEFDVGQSYVVFGSGSGFPAALDLSALNGSNGFAINGVAQGDWSGWSVSGAGDANNDGIDDLLIGAGNADPGGYTNAGQAYVIFGQSSFSATFDLGSLNGSNGFVLNGEADWDHAGWSVSGAGDINADGLPDLLVSASEADAGAVDSGKGYVIFGNSTFPAALDLSALNGSNGFALNGIDATDFAGQSVSGAGDVNLDGVADLLIGANNADPNGNAESGEVYVLFGRSNPFPAAVNLADLDGSNGYTLNGIGIGDQAGYTVSGAGDFDGDGVADLLIGAPHAAPGMVNQGQSYLLFGRPRVTTLTATPADFIRFVPDAGFTGSAKLMFRAWDTTDGHLSGDTNVLMAGAGGAFAYSSALETATLNILSTPPDLSITQTASPAGLRLPGQTITYTIAFSNAGAQSATGVVITQAIPAVLDNRSVVSSGVSLTAVGGQEYVWQVGNLAEGQGGMITVTGRISPNLDADLSFTGAVTITGSQPEANTQNNRDSTITSVTLPRVYFAAAASAMNETAGTATVTARLNIAAAQEVTVNFATSDGTAVAGNDYSAAAGTVTFSPGETVQAFTVSILDDVLDEAAETFDITLNSPFRAVLAAPAQTTLTILNNDVTVTGLTAANNGPTALGSGTTLWAGISGGNDVTYIWDFGDGQSGSGATVNHTYPAPGTYTAVVTATNAVNQLSAGTSVVVQQAVAGLNAAGSSPTLLGQATALTATISGGTDVTYVWNFGDGQSGSGSTVNHTYAAVGTYNVTVTAANGVSSQTDQVAVTVVDVPVSGLQAGNNSPKTLSQPVLLSAAISGGSNVTYNWDFGDGQSGSGATVSHMYPPVVGVYTATVTAGNSVSSQSDTTVVTITDIPVAGLAVSSDSPRIFGQLLNLNATSAAGSNITYSWDFGDGTAPEAGGSSISHLYGAPGNYTVTLTASNGMGSVSATTPVTILARTCWVRLNNSATDYFYVQDAVNDSSSTTDVVKVAGTCTGVSTAPAYNTSFPKFTAKQQVLLNKTLTLRGGYTHTNWSTYNWTANPTTLDATGQGRVLFVTDNAAPTIEGLTLTGGNANNLGGSAVGDIGGGVYVRSADPGFVGNRIINNSADQGGGIWMLQSNGVISNNLISGNQATSSDGGGLYIYQGVVTVMNNVITANTTSRYGGGAYLYQGSTRFEQNQLLDNVAQGGGGAYMWQSSGTFENNTVSGNQATVMGGGAYLFDNTATVRQNSFTQNNAVWGGGMYIYKDGSAVNGNTVMLNTAGTGGGVFLNESNNTLANAFIINNQASSYGSGVHVLSSQPTLAHLTVVGNSGGTGAGVYVTSGASKQSDVQLVNNVLAGNTVGVYVDSTDTARVNGALWGSDSWANTADWAGPGNLITGTTSIWGDPAFVNPGLNDYHITLSSAGLDSGAVNAVTDDFDGAHRPAGGGFDMGADEIPVALNVNHWAAPNPVEPGMELLYTLAVTNVESFDLPVTIQFTPPGFVTPGGIRTWTPTLSGSGGTWTTQLTATVNSNAVGPLVSTLYAASTEGDFTNTYAVGVEKAISNLTISNDSPTPLGGITTMTASATGDNINYSWQFGDGEVGSGSVITHTYLAAGDYPVVVVAGNGVSVVSATMTAVVEESVAGLDVTYSTPVAAGQSTALLATVTGGSHLNYSWDFDDGQIGSGAVVNHTYGAAGTVHPTVVAANHVSQMTKTVTIVVQQPVSGLAAASSSPTQLNQATALTATIGAGTDVYYVWNFGDGQAGSGAKVNHTYAAVGTYTATVIAGNGVSVQSAPVTVTVTDIPVAGLTATDNSPTVLGQLTTLTAGVTGGSNVNYSWDFGDGSSGSGASVTHQYPAVGSYTARVTAANSASTQSAVTTVTVVDEAISGLTFISSSPDNLGEPTSFSAWVIDGSNVNYSWDFGDGSSGSGTPVNHTYAAGGARTVSLTASNGVGSQTVTGTVIINRPPVAVLALDAVTGTIEHPITASAVGSYDSDNDDLSFTFSFGGERVIGPQSSPVAEYTFRSGAVHTVQVTVSDGKMSSTASQTIDIKSVPLLAVTKTGPARAYAGQRITYTLTITNLTQPPGSSPAAVLQLSNTDLNFHGTEGEASPGAKTFGISNGGTGDLVWLVRENADWLALDQLSGSGPATIQASVDSSGLSRGVYTEKIVVDAGLAQDGLQTVDATLTLFCTGRQPVDVMLALDKSGSMYGTPFANAQDAVKKFVNLMDLSTDQVGLVSFNSTATINHTLTQNGEAVKSTVDAQTAGGLTDIAEAINDAHSELMSQRRIGGNTPVMVVLSDGTQTVEGSPVTEAAQAKNDGIRIISIGLGRANTVVLQQIASSPADYYYAPTSDDLSLIYNRIAVEVGCPGSASNAVFSLAAAEFNDPLAPVFRTMPAAAGESTDASTAYNLVITDTIPAGASYAAGGSKEGNVVRWTIPELPPNTSVQVSFAVIATESIVNDDYGVRADDGFGATGTDQVVTTVLPRPVPQLSVAKWASTGQVVGTQEVTYSYLVTNTGTATLSNITVDDDILGFVDGKETLVPGESWLVTKNGLVIEDVTNIATARATSPFGPAQATASATVDFKPDWPCGATIRSVGNGDWKNSSTWEPARIPNHDDIVWVQGAHTVIIKATSHTNIRALCNYGTLRSTSKQQLHIVAHDFLHNYGTIESTDGAGGMDYTCGHPANNLKLAGSPIINWGTIQSGDGGDGEHCGGRGGSVMIMGHNTTNYGTICAGKGGNVLGTDKGKQGHSGKGGDTHVWGNHGGPGMLLNTGLLCAGDGGNGNPTATREQRGGDGGDLKIISEPDVILSGGRYYAGQGGNGTGGGRNGKDGRVFIEPVTISLAGPNTEVKGGDIIIFGGENATLDLSNMNGAAIEATGNITVAVGSGGSINFADNVAGSDVLQAGAQVFVASDNIVLNSGTNLADVVNGNVSVGGAQILNDVSLGAPTFGSGQVGATLPLTLTVMNSGPTNDTYTLNQQNSAGWTLTGIPPSVAVSGLSASDLPLNISIPDSAQVGVMQKITLTATSQNDPAVSKSTMIEIEVAAGPVSGENRLYLPLIVK